MIWLDKGFQRDNPEFREMADFFNIEGEVYREPKGANRRTLKFRRYFLKLHWGVGWKEIFKNLVSFRLPVIGAKNEWLAIRKLASLGVDVQQLRAYGEAGWNPASKKSFIVTQELENYISLEDYCQNWKSAPPALSKKRRLIRKVAQIANLMHDSGLNHRDFYICHLLLRQPWDGSKEHLLLVLIDLHRAQIRARTPVRWLVKDVGALWYSAMEIGLSKRDLLLFFLEYTKSGSMRRLRDDPQFWRKVGDRAISLKNKPVVG